MNAKNFRNNLRTKLATKLGAGAVLATVAGAASAQSTGPDVSSITTVIAGCGAAVASIGLAVLAVHYGAKVYKWIRGAG